MNSPIKSFRLPAELFSELRALSSESGIPISEIVRACIVRALPYVRDLIKNRPR